MTACGSLKKVTVPCKQYFGSGIPGTSSKTVRKSRYSGMSHVKLYAFNMLSLPPDFLDRIVPHFRPSVFIYKPLVISALRA